MDTTQECGKPTVVRIKRERKELIAKYATAAVCLYGIISVSEYVSVFNHYEEEKTTSEETVLALRRYAKTNDVEYSIAGDIISGPEFQPEFDDYEDNVTAIRENQSNKPRYLPDKEELLRYLDFDYREPEKPYADLKAYIMKNGITHKSEGLNGVDGDLMNLHEMIQFGVKTNDYLDYFTKVGYNFKSIETLNGFMQMVMNVHNNTRMYDNNGFTPNELFEQFERPTPKPLPQEPFNLSATLKVGRNASCPCGSGLKYKKCHGK